MAITPLQSRVEEILAGSTNIKPQSRIEILLIELLNSLDLKADLVDGLIPLEEIPPVAVEHMVIVADDTARFALTTTDVQNGDTVKVASTNKMYLVKDDTHLNSEAGYEVYVAGRAAEAVADQNGNVINTTYATKAVATPSTAGVGGTDGLMSAGDKEKLNGCKTVWIGTQEQYEALVSDDYDLYCIKEAVS